MDILKLVLDCIYSKNYDPSIIMRVTWLLVVLIKTYFGHKGMKKSNLCILLWRKGMCNLMSPSLFSAAIDSPRAPPSIVYPRMCQ